MKNYNAKRRKTIIDIAKNLGCTDIDYLDKNSNITDEKAIMYIEHHHCPNDTFRRMFKERINSLN